MDTSDPEIAFDGDGRCSHCAHYARRAAAELFSGDEANRRLDAAVAAMKLAGRGREYDCIIGVSGGADSSYVAYLVRTHGLRPLAVHLDNGWDSELAVHNVSQLLHRLGIDLYTHVIDWEEFRDLQLAFLKAGVANSEAPTDHAILSLLFRIASRERVRYIVTGSNVIGEAILPRSWGYDCRDWRQIHAIHRLFGTIPLKTYPHMTTAHFGYYTFVRHIRTFRILNYVSYVKKDAIALMERELGWRNYGGKHYESIYTRFFQGYILPTRFGFDKRRAHFSTLINSGQMTRAQAMEELEQPPYPLDQVRDDREFVIKKLGVTPAEFDEILSRPTRSYRDYPSNRIIFEQMPGPFRLVKRAAVRA
jgi:N-acetyl sugar amidotransferase